MTIAVAAKPLKLPFWRTVGQSYLMAFQNFAWFLRVAWLWLVVLIVASAVFYWLSWPDIHASHIAGRTSLLDMAIYPISLLIASSIAVAWHRRLLTGEDVSSVAYFRLDRNVLRYFAWGLLFTLFWLVPLIVIELWSDGLLDAQGGQAAVNAGTVASPDSEISEASIERDDWWQGPAAALGMLLVFAVLSYIPLRLSLVLPALALGHSTHAVRNSWRSTTGNFWRLFWGTALTTFVPMVASVSLLFAFGFGEDAPERLPYVLENVYGELSLLISGIFGLAFLSLSYRYLHQPEVSEEL